MAILYYIHDPMCAWCWGYRPTWTRLKARLPAGVEVRNLLGGLAPDSDAPMPTEIRDRVQGHWRRIKEMLGTEFNFNFWAECRPRRSTYPACRAVLAAAAQDAEETMILAIQRAYYLRAMNPSDNETLVVLADELDLDCGRFVIDLLAPETHRQLLAQIEQGRELGVSSFPSLVLEAEDGIHPVAIDYHDPAPSLRAIQRVLPT